MKVLSIVGARPQFIKASVVSQALEQAGIQETVVHTGQHYDHGMSQLFFDELGMAAPAVNLATGSGSHADQTARMLVGLEQAIVDGKPDWVLVYGDTNSTLAGSLAAAKLLVPVAHVEAGLRSYNRKMPEEINRIVADSLSSLLFAPTVTAMQNLASEGAPEEKTLLVGDVMFDASLVHGQRAKQSSSILAALNLTDSEYVLATIHRAENTDDPVRLRAIVEGLSTVAKTLPVVWPLHPRTKAALSRSGLEHAASDALRIIGPVGYLDMVMLESCAALIATDSGGVQKEAFFHRVPCVTLRDETEWVETVEMGWNRLSPPTNATKVADTITSSIGSRGSEGAPYGEGDASRRVAAALLAGGANPRIVANA